MKYLFNKTTLIFSPNTQTGKTTIANYLGQLFAQKGYLTAVIELDRYCSTTQHIQDGFSRIKKMEGKGLKEAIEAMDSNVKLNCFSQSPHHENLFTLSLLPNSELDDLYKFPINEITEIIKIAKSKFDKVFIDAPSNYIETGLIAALNSQPDQCVLIMDDNYTTWHKLKLYDLFFSKSKIPMPRTITIINKFNGLLPTDEILEAYNKDFNVISCEDVHIIPFLKRIIKANNEGVVLADITPSNLKEKKFKKTLTYIVDYIESDGTTQPKRRFLNFDKTSKDANATL